MESSTAGFEKTTKCQNEGTYDDFIVQKANSMVGLDEESDFFIPKLVSFLLMVDNRINLLCTDSIYVVMFKYMSHMLKSKFIYVIFI